MNLAAMERDLETLKQEGLALIKTTAEKADVENRDMTDDERTAIKAISDKGVALKARIERGRGDESMMAEINRLTGNDNGHRSSRTATAIERRSLGEQFVASAEYKDFFGQGRHKTSSTWRSPGFEITPPDPRFAATLTEDPASGGALVVPQYLPGILALPMKRLVIADLLAPGTTTSNLISYMREKTWVNAANTVLEGAAKPEDTLTFEPAQDPVRKIAHWLPVSEEMLEDVAQIRSYIDARLQLGVQIEEEDQLLNGTGVAPDLLGLLLRPGLAADMPRGADPATNADAILKQIMAIFATSFLMPDGVVINPINWTSILLSKTAQGNYLTGGPFAPIQSATLWGLPVVPTPSIVAGTSLVGVYKQAGQVFRKGGIRVEASNSHQDFFVKNLVAIRAEERIALAVYRPGAFGKVTGLN